MLYFVLCNTWNRALACMPSNKRGLPTESTSWCTYIFPRILRLHSRVRIILNFPLIANFHLLLDLKLPDYKHEKQRRITFYESFRLESFENYNRDNRFPPNLRYLLVISRNRLLLLFRIVRKIFYIRKIGWNRSIYHRHNSLDYVKRSFRF